MLTFDKNTEKWSLLKSVPDRELTDLEQEATKAEWRLIIQMRVLFLLVLFSSTFGLIFSSTACSNFSDEKSCQKTTMIICGILSVVSFLGFVERNVKRCRTANSSSLHYRTRV